MRHGSVLASLGASSRKRKNRNILLKLQPDPELETYVGWASCSTKPTSISLMSALRSAPLRRLCFTTYLQRPAVLVNTD